MRRHLVRPCGYPGVGIAGQRLRKSDSEVLCSPIATKTRPNEPPT
jgi:hypothetical protein